MDKVDTEQSATVIAVERGIEPGRWETKERLVFGRHTECDVVVPSSRVSRRHCTLEFRQGEWWVADHGSRNGTRIDGSLIEVATVRSGSRITVGGFSFLFVVNAGPSASGAASGAGHDHSRTVEISATLEAASIGSLAPQERGRRDLQWLLEVIAAVSACEGVDQLLSEPLGLLQGQLDLSAAGFFLSDGSPIAASVEDSSLIEASAKMMGRCVDEGRSLLVTHAPGSRAGSAGEDSESNRGRLAVAPLVAGKEPFGVLLVAAGERPLTKSDLRLLTLIGITCGNAIWRLYRDESLRQASTVGVGESAAWRRVRSMVERLAGIDSTVLLRGESGTGKEVVATALHEHGGRRHGPFVPVNCATLSETLLESELFGHERGAFTGAVSAKPGRFELARNGTLFLDEIGEVPLGLQAKLLRALESKEVMRVGGTRATTVDVRIVAATNRDLKAAVADGEFREDLYYRLDVIAIDLPPLRDRARDIASLSQHFLVAIAAELGVEVPVVEPEVERALSRYRWPGNVRELRNVIERALALGAGDAIRWEDLPEGLREQEHSLDVEGYHAEIDALKRRLIRDAVAAEGGNISAAARALGLSPNYLHRLITNLGLRD